jgi:hypothetical protein
MAFGRLNPVEFQEPNRLPGGEMSSFPIGRAQLERRNDFAIVFELLPWHHTGLTVITTTYRAGLQALAQGFIEGIF